MRARLPVQRNQVTGTLLLVPIQAKGQERPLACAPVDTLGVTLVTRHCACCLAHLVF